jgi:hypothetical protein
LDFTADYLREKGKQKIESKKSCRFYREKKVSDSINRMICIGIWDPISSTNFFEMLRRKYLQISQWCYVAN